MVISIGAGFLVFVCFFAAKEPMPVLNWFFMAGLHHFYLESWVRGCIHLSIFVVGIVLIIIGLVWAGILIILSVSIVELYALFQSQLIVQNYNNQVMQKAIEETRKFKT